MAQSEKVAKIDHMHDTALQKKYYLIEIDTFQRLDLRGNQTLTNLKFFKNSLKYRQKITTRN